MRWGWVACGFERADVHDGALKRALRALFHHFIGGSGKYFGDVAGTTPSNNVFGAAAGARDLSVGRWHVNFHFVANLKMCWRAVIIQTIFCCFLKIGSMRTREAVEGVDGRAEGIDEQGRGDNRGRGGIGGHSVVEVGISVRVRRSER